MLALTYASTVLYASHCASVYSHLAGLAALEGGGRVHEGAELVEAQDAHEAHRRRQTETAQGTERGPEPLYRHRAESEHANARQLQVPGCPARRSPAPPHASVEMNTTRRRALRGWCLSG